MRKKENVEGSAGDAISAAGLEHVVQEAGDISRVGDRDVKALGGSVHHLEQLGGGVVLFQVTGLAIGQVQEQDFLRPACEAMGSTSMRVR